MLSAPMLAAFGVRGLYVLPAAGFIATIAACAWLAVVLDPRRNAVIVAVTAALGTPFLFYGLEFWEHMPALALGVLGAALLLEAARRRPGQHADTRAAFAAGLLMGAAIVLRPEALCFAVAVAFASRWVVHRPTWRSLAIAGAGAATAVLPLEIYTLVHFGSFVPGHIGVNAGVAGGLQAAGRLRLASDWLLPSLWSSSGPLDLRSFWSVALAAVVAVLGAVMHHERQERVFLGAVAAGTVLFVVMTAPNDGGGQWGPRYLLFAYVPLVVLAADVIQQFPRRRPTWVVLLVLVVASGVWVQRTAYRQLRGTKATYGRVVDFVARNGEPGDPVVTDAWWLDQLAASALDRRTLLFAGEPKTGADIVQRLSDARVPSVTVVRSREESRGLEPWIGNSCYVEQRREELPVRRLVAMRLTRDENCRR
jgi:hypothetical protein